MSTVEQSALLIRVKQPEIEHRVRIRDFERWLTSAGKSPAEQALNSDLQDLLKDRIEEKRVAANVTLGLAAGSPESVTNSARSANSNVASVN